MQLLPTLARVEGRALADLRMDFIGWLKSTCTVPVNSSHRAAHLIKSIFDVAVDLPHLIIVTEVG